MATSEAEQKEVIDRATELADDDIEAAHEELKRIPDDSPLGQRRHDAMADQQAAGQWHQSAVEELPIADVEDEREYRHSVVSHDPVHDVAGVLAPGEHEMVHRKRSPMVAVEGKLGPGQRAGDHLGRRTRPV